MLLELIVLPVSDVDRSIAFYAERIGFPQDFDVRPGEGVRGVHLVVEDLDAARAELVGRGVEVSEIRDFGGGVRGAGFADPDGNAFELQEMAWRKGVAC